MAEERNLEVQVFWRPSPDIHRETDLSAFSDAFHVVGRFAPKLDGQFIGFVLGRKGKASKTLSTFERHFRDAARSDNQNCSGTAGHNLSESSQILVSVGRRAIEKTTDEVAYVAVSWSLGDKYSDPGDGLLEIAYSLLHHLAVHNCASWGTAAIRRTDLPAQIPHEVGRVSGVTEGHIMSVGLFEQFASSTVLFSDHYESADGPRVVCLFDLETDDGAAKRLLQQLAAPLHLYDPYDI